MRLPLRTCVVEASGTLMDRRSFIKLTAITGTSATLASCGNPEHQLIRFVPDEDIVPGRGRVEAERVPAVQRRLRPDGARHGSGRRRRARTARRA